LLPFVMRWKARGINRGFSFEPLTHEV
jgi:hypothetical protein